MLIACINIVEKMIQCCSNRCHDKEEFFVTELNSSLLWRPETVCFRREVFTVDLFITLSSAL